MTTKKPVARLFFVAAVAALVALPGCGASPTAPKTVKKAATVAKATTPAATAPIAAKTATTATTPVAAKPAAQDETTTTMEEPTAPAEHTSVPVGAQSTGTSTSTSIEAIAEAALSPETMNALDASLTAEVVDQKNGVLFGMGSFKCTIQVTNNSDTERTGMLKVTFMNKDKPSTTDPTLQLVTIPAHGSASFDFADTKWSTDNVTAEVTPTTHGQSLAAFVLSKKNGVILGMGTFKTTIEVVNPDDEERTGTLVVQFRNGSKDSETAAIRQPVTLAAHGTKTFDFEDKKWTTDNVAVTVE